MKKGTILCIVLALLSLTACSLDRSNKGAEIATENSYNYDDLNSAYDEGYSIAVHEIEGTLRKWDYCICVNPEDLSDAIVEYGIRAGLSDEKAEDLRDMILSDLDGTSMEKIISEING